MFVTTIRLWSSTPSKATVLCTAACIHLLAKLIVSSRRRTGSPIGAGGPIAGAGAEAGADRIGTWFWRPIGLSPGGE